MTISNAARPATPTSLGYVVTHYPRVTQTFIAAEIDGLRRAGHCVRPIAMNPPGPADADHPDVETTHYLKTTAKTRVLGLLGRTLVRHPGPFLRLLFRALRTAGTDARKLSKRAFHFVEALLIWDLTVREDIEHLHAHIGQTPSTLAMWAAEFGRLTDSGAQEWSFTVHCASEMHDPTWALNQAKVQSARTTVCVADHTRSHLMWTTDPADWHKLVTVRCGIDLPSLPQRAPKPLGDPPTVIIVGRLAAAKGHLVLLEAMAQARDAGHPLRLEVIGGGELRDEIEAAIAAHGLNDMVDLVGEVPPSDVRPRVSDADIFCLPSFDEGLPISIMEAMAIGVPVISTYIAGIPELAANNETALVVPPGNVEALAEALVKLSTDAELRDRLVVNARKAVEQHHDAADTVPALEQALLGE